MNNFENFNINLDNFYNKLCDLIDDNKKQIDNLLKIKDKNYNNFVIPFELLSVKLEQFFTKISHINSVKNSDLTNDIYEKSIEIITKYHNELLQNISIYKALKSIKDNNKTLNYEQNRVLELQIQEYQLNGCSLDDDKKEQLKKIDLKLSKLSNDFSQNLLKATKEFELICKEEDIIKMPNSTKEIYKVKNRYKFSLQAPSYIAFITYSNNRQLREKIYKAYTTRAPNNEDIIEKIVSLKQKKANILGFKNYALLSLEEKLANSEDEVINFLYEIVKYAKPKAIQELKEVQDIAKNDAINSIEAYDVAYYSQILKEQNYNIDEEFYKQYFEQNSVINGLFEFLEKIFDIRFEQIDEKSWDEKVKIYLVYENNILISKLYLDLEAREDKRGGAWMDDFETRYDIDGFKQLPSAFVVANFTPSTNLLPSLLTHDEVVTLFHEMGHALHHILSKTKEPFVSGINGVEWDGVEFPSQFLEYFAYEKDILKIFAKHYKTKKILDDNSIDRLKRVRNFQSAMQTIRQVEFALFDFKLYQKARNKTDIQKLLDEIRDEVAVTIPPRYNKFQNSFSHIFAGGYSAGYYSYKWAEVMSATAYTIFKNPLDLKNANRFKNIVLYQGGTKSMEKIFYEFANKNIDVKSLLKIDGIL